MILNLDPKFAPFQNQEEIKFQSFTFSGGEPHIKINPDFDPNRKVTITHRLNSFNDLGLLCITVDALRRMDVKIIDLFIPYFPAARQDRVMIPGEPLSVKVYADIINSLQLNKVTVFEGLGSFEDATHVKVTKADGTSEVIEGKNIIIATGSKPSNLPFIKLDKERIITSTEALKLPEVPKHLVIIGGGVIGIELGQVYLRLGAQVSVVEFMDRIIPGMDAALSKELTKVLKKQGMKFYTSHKVQSVERNGDVVTVQAENAKGETITLEGDYSLVSVGRRPYTDGLNADKAGVKISDRGQVEVNDHLQTSVPNIYAIGDVVRGAMLAHKAEEEGVMVAEILAGQKPHIDYNLIPGVVYTWPEVAAVGKTEEQLKADGVEYKAGSFPFKALGRARAGGDLDGFVKILADAKTDEVLGVHMIGARCADLIAEAVTAMEFRASAEDISRMSHAHPTFAEAIKEAALAATENRALHV